MPLDTKTVGVNERQVVTVGDPASASNYGGVNAFGDDQNLGSQFGQLTLAVPLLKDSGGNFDVARSAIGTTGIPAVSTEGAKPTYSFGVIGFTPAATATDFLELLGSGSKTIRLLWLEISGFATAAATVSVKLHKRSSANTGGTKAAISPVAAHDSNDAAATAIPSTYSVNPTALGTDAGIVRAEKLNLGAAGAAGKVLWDFTKNNDKAAVLRGTSQLFALNWNGAAVPAGTSLDICGEFSEE